MSQENKITIVQIVRSAQYGGVETHVCDLLEYGLRAGFDMKLLSLSQVEPSEAFRRCGAELILLPDSQWMSGTLATDVRRSLLNAYRLYRTLKRLRPDIVHLHGTRPVFIGSLAAKAAGVKHVFSTMHNSHALMAIRPDGSVDRLLGIIAKIMCLSGIVCSSRVMAVSDAIKSELEQLSLSRTVANYVRAKSTTRYLGVEVDRYQGRQDRIRKEYRIDDAEVVIGSVTRLDEPKKGLSVLLKAVRLLKDRGFRVKLCIAGDGSSRQQLTRLADQLCLSSDVFFLGYCLDTGELYGNFDIFVLPSLFEGLGIVNLEAMAASLPVVASRVGGIPEAVRHLENGILVPPNDECELAEALAYLITNRARAAEMGKKGREIATREFNKENSLGRIFGEYAAVLKPAP